MATEVNIAQVDMEFISLMVKVMLFISSLEIS